MNLQNHKTTFTIISTLLQKLVLPSHKTYLHNYTFTGRIFCLLKLSKNYSNIDSSKQLPSDYQKKELRCYIAVPLITSLPLENSSYSKNRLISHRRIFDSRRWCTCMDNCSVSDIDSYMSAVTDDITRLSLIHTYSVTGTS